MLRRMFKGRVLGVKTGLNPNSSSLGANTVWILVWSSGLAVLAPFLSLLVKGVSSLKRGFGKD